MGSREVAGMGMDSVTHQMAINAVTAATRQACMFSPGGGGANNMAAKISGPTKKPMYDARSPLFNLLLIASLSKYAAACSRGLVAVVPAG
jgi:hypothetical protein